MRHVRVVNATRGTELAARVGVADRWWQRLRGLLGTSALPPGEGLLLTPCRSVHTWGMRYAIDVLFLNHDGRLVAVHPVLSPGARTALYRDAHQVLELPAGTLAKSINLHGDRFEIDPLPVIPDAAA